MNRFIVALAVCVGVLISSCKNEDSQPNATQQGPSLTATPAGVTIGAGGSQNVSITGGVHPYTAQPQNPALTTVQFVTNADTAVLMITGVTTATGTTSVIVRDASTPQQKSVTVSVVKVP